MQVFVIASQEEDFLTGIVVAFPLGVEVSKSIEDAYESAVRRWPNKDILEPCLWEETPVEVRLSAIAFDREIL
jgi:hypothetical protein